MRRIHRHRLGEVAQWVECSFTADDRPSSERVVIVNERLARALWPDRDPLDRVLRASGLDYRVVGVVDDVRYFALDRDTGQEMYMLLGQTGDYETVDLVVRSAVPPAGVIPGVRAALKRADSGLPAVELEPMEQLVERSVFQGSTTLVHVRLAHGPSLQVLVANGGREDPPKDGSAVTVVVPPGALRLLAKPAESIAAGDPEPAAAAV